MSEAESPENLSQRSASARGRGNITPLFGRPAKSTAAPQHQPSAPQNIAFDRNELREILALYGRKVAEGEWRDYAINFTQQKAIFSVFRRSSEMPLYRIEKDPELSVKQGTYAVIVATGLILRRGNDLKRVLAILEKKPRLVVV